MLAKNNQHRVTIITSFLERKLVKSAKQKPAFCNAISGVIHAKGLLSVDEMAKRSFLSVRQFERNFKTYSGFSPKLYSRIIRFQAATQQYGNTDKSLTNIAYECGYSDQSHFIHDFKQFSGYHPKQYFSGKAEGVEWKNVLD
jgi:transcriptional regulator GlxA family with amidase domain